MTSNWDEVQKDTLSILADPDNWGQYGCGELLHVLFPGLIIYATTNNEKMVGSLMAMYQTAMQICPVPERRNFYTELKNVVIDIPPAPNVFMPFLLVESDRPIVAEATIDFAMMAGRVEDGLIPVEQLFGFLSDGLAANPGALYGGLIFLGDPRVVRIIWGYRYQLSDEEISEAARSRTVYPTVDAFDFWLRWAEDLATQGETESGRFGSVVSAMAMIIRDDSVNSFSKANRRFGYVHSKDKAVIEMETFETYTRKEYGGSILDRLYALERVEAPPKLTSDVILRFGYEPKAPFSQQYRDAYDAQ